MSKDRLDVHLRPSGEAFAVARDGKGLENLVQRLAALDVSLIVLEATGGFETTVAAALAGAGLPLAVVNPRQIRDFARALGRLAKTDAIDAAVIASFAEKIRPEARPLAPRDARNLGELVARRRQIVEMIGMEANRRRRAADKRLVKKIDRHIAFLEKELADIDAEIDAGVRASPAWREAEDLLTSVPGVGFPSRREPSSPNCPNLVGWIAPSSPHSSASRRSIAIWDLARPSHDRRRPGLPSARSSTWPPSSPRDATP